MSKNSIISLLVVIFLAGAALLPLSAGDDSSVFWQHTQWPQEQTEQTGFDAEGVLTSHLPLVILYTEGKEIPGVDRSSGKKLLCDYSIIYNENGINRATDQPISTGRTAISVRGNSSRIYPKKQYAMRLLDEQGQPENRVLLGMPAESNWVLNGSNLDVSQLRNYLLYNISGEIMDYAPRCRLCEVILTDENGVQQYQGVYTLIEKIKVSKNRVNLPAYDPAYAETSFMIQMNADIDHVPILHIKPDSIPAYKMDLEYPSTEELTDASKTYVQEQILIFEKALFDAVHTKKWDRLESMIDMDSFVDYYLINEFFQNYDAGTRSTYLYRGLGDVIHIGPVWDFDGAFDNFFGLEIHADYLELRNTLFFACMTQSPHFNAQCAARYRQLRNTILSEEHLLKLIQDSADYLGSAAERNTVRWYNSDRSYFEEDIQKMLDFVKSRGKWMDRHFVSKSELIG